MKNTKILSVALLPILAVSLAYPSLTFAKGDKGERKEKKEQREERKEERKEENKNKNKSLESCTKAFGHLIAPGWIKKNGTTTRDVNCIVPIGISKKFATSTDVTAPVISDTGSITGTTFALVHWYTNEATRGTLYVSTTTPVSTTTARSVVATNWSPIHFSLIQNLEANTTYYALLVAQDKAGNMTTSSQFTFTTKAGATSTPVDTTAPALSNITASSITSNGAVITWTTNENSDTQVEYGTTSYGTQSVLNSSLITNHSVTLTGLLPQTTYNFRVKSKDASGNLAVSSNFTFTTGAVVDTTAPVISSINSTVGTSTIAVSWTTNEPATSKVYFSAGTPADVNTSMAIFDNTLVTNHSMTLAGLATGTPHYLIIESKDASNNTATSSQITLTTLAN